MEEFRNVPKGHGVNDAFLKSLKSKYSSRNPDAKRVEIKALFWLSSGESTMIASEGATSGFLREVFFYVYKGRLQLTIKFTIPIYAIAQPW